MKHVNAAYEYTAPIRPSMSNLDWGTEYEEDLAAEIASSKYSAAEMTEFSRELEDDETLVASSGAFPLVRAVCICLSLLAHLALAAVPGSLPGAAVPVLMEFNLVALPGTPDAPLSGEGIEKGMPDGQLNVPDPPATTKPQAPPKPAPKKPVVEKRPVPPPPSPAPRVVKRPAKEAPPKPIVPERLSPAADARPSNPDQIAADDHANSEQDVGASGEHTAAADSSGADTPHASGAAQPRGLPTGSGSGRFGSSVGGGGSTYTFGEAGAPSFLRRVVPKYPRQSVARREEGVVVLLLSLDERGVLLDVSVEQSAGSRLDEAAIQAARASAYKPATVNGKAQACRARLPVRFRLRK